MFREMSYAPEDHAIIFLLAGIVSGLRAKVERGLAEDASGEKRDSRQGQLVESTA